MAPIILAHGFSAAREAERSREARDLERLRVARERMRAAAETHSVDVRRSSPMRGLLRPRRV